jgi:chorismate-pyruvate lyase
MAPTPDRMTTLHPLTEFYRESGVAAPRVEPIEGSLMPEPYRRLLVHRNDMTPTLEGFCGKKIHLRLLEKHTIGDAMYRRVILEANGSSTPVEFGAIKIDLARFPEEPRALIVEAYRPLGTILHDYGIRHSSRPTCFFRVVPDKTICEAFGMAAAPTLYGRHNVIYDASERTLAEVVEILPLFEEGKFKEKHA